MCSRWVLNRSPHWPAQRFPSANLASKSNCSTKSSLEDCTSSVKWERRWWVGIRSKDRSSRFTMLASQGPGAPLTKAGLRVGDRLILTKPLGTGVLLAAHMQARCEARWMDTLLPTMLLSNQPAAQLVNGFDILGLTDVTGFGLAGHLLEMLRASNASAELLLDQIPLLAGVGELVSEGIESTLGPANRAVEANIRVTERQRRDSRYASLFDPQTSGGLLLGVRESQVDAVLSRLAELSDVPAAVIGDVVESVDREPSIKIARGEGPEVRSQKPEARSQKSEISDD